MSDGNNDEFLDSQESNEVVNEDNKPEIKRKKAKKPERKFPHYGLVEARQIADLIKKLNNGNAWEVDSLASALNMGKGNNDFYYLTAASRDYGITLGTRNTKNIELTELGKKLVYPNSQLEESIAIEAVIRNVELFAKVLDYYGKENLPEIKYLKNTLKTQFGIDESLQDDFYDVYQKNLQLLKQYPVTLDSEPSARKQEKGAQSSIVIGDSVSRSELVAFVAMPFSEKTGVYADGYFDEVLKHLITPAAVNAGFNARTAKKAGSEVIQATIVNDLDVADLVIVDLTEHNPNVLFELGMRIAFDKPVCIIKAKGTPAIFDIDHMLRVYEYNPCLWKSTLDVDIPQLTEHIKGAWENRLQLRSYLAILKDS